MCLDIHWSNLWADLSPLQNLFVFNTIVLPSLACVLSTYTCNLPIEAGHLPSSPFSSSSFLISQGQCATDATRSHNHLSCLHIGHAATPLAAIAMAAKFINDQFSLLFRLQMLFRKTSSTTVTPAATSMLDVILRTSEVTQLFIYYGKREVQSLCQFVGLPEG